MHIYKNETPTLIFFNYVTTKMLHEPIRIKHFTDMTIWQFGKLSCGQNMKLSPNIRDRKIK